MGKVYCPKLDSRALRRLILFKHRLIVSSTKALSPARSHLSGLCGQRLQQLVLHELALLSLFFNGIRTCPPRAANQPSPDHKPETAKPSNPLHPRGYSISVLIAQRPAVPAVCKKRISKALLTPVNHWHPTVVNDLAEGGKPPANRVFWGSSARPPECPTDPALFDFCFQDFNRNQRNQTTPFLIHSLHT